MVDLSKRSWFKARLHTPAPLRPPWSLDEPEFTALCTRCDACVEACPENVIKKADGGFPELDFSQAECTFCEACLSACSDGALASTRRPVMAQRPEIGAGCLTREGIYCRSCADVCDQAAIVFTHSKENRHPAIAQPGLDLDLCTGCGACVSTCPADAIQFVPPAQPARERANYA